MNLAACRSATLRSKIVMRFGCCLVAASLAMSCFATPRAKAVVSETALLGSIFGSLLVSMGFSWAAENMDVPTFGESIYKLIQEHDEANKDTGVQLIRDLNIAALTSGRPGTIQFNYAWTQAARSFADWFQGKYFVNGNTAVIPGNSFSFNYQYADSFILNFPVSVTALKSLDVYDSSGWTIKIPITTPGTYLVHQSSPSRQSGVSEFVLSVISVIDASGNDQLWNSGNYRWFADDYSLASDDTFTVTSDMVDAGYSFSFTVRGLSKFGLFKGNSASFSNAVSFNYADASSLTAEKPAEVHYPDVAEDGSQVYEVTYQGVTATDIEGIIQSAVDRILAGTAAIAGEVTQAQDVPADPEVPPELDGLDLPALGAALTSRFPFSIPWDFARGIGLLAAPAETPHFEVDFFEPISDLVGGWKGSTKIVLDFSEFEIIGRLCRWTSTIGFCLMLAAGTKRLIWVA